MKELLKDYLGKETYVDSGSVTIRGELVSVTDSYFRIKNSEGTYVYPYTGILEIHGSRWLTIKTLRTYIQFLKE